MVPGPWSLALEPCVWSLALVPGSDPWPWAWPVWPCRFLQCGHAGLSRVAMQAILAPLVAMQASRPPVWPCRFLMSFAPQVIEGLATTRGAYPAEPTSIEEYAHLHVTYECQANRLSLNEITMPGRIKTV